MPKDVRFYVQNAPNSIFGAPDTAGELTVLPRPHSWIYGDLLLRGGEGEGKEGKRMEGKGMEGNGREGKGREGQNPVRKNLATGLHDYK